MNPPSPFLYPKAEGLAPTSSKNALFTSTTYQKLAFLVFGGGDLYQLLYTYTLMFVLLYVLVDEYYAGYLMWIDV